LLQEAIVDGAGGVPADFDVWKEQARAALRMAVGEGDPMVDRFDAIRYGLSVWTDGTPQSAFDGARRAGVRKGLAILEAAKTVADTGQDAQRLAAEDLPESLHVWVSGVAKTLWKAALHRQAVEEAARNIEIQLKAKLGKADGTGAALVTDAFSVKPPKADNPRLRFVGFELGTSDWTNAREGAMSFGRGCMMRVRNLYTHGREPSNEEAFEALIALSLLARWIDEATVQTAV